MTSSGDSTKLAVQSLPQELQDAIFQYTLLAELPGPKNKNLWCSEVSIPRPKTKMCILMAYMKWVLDHRLNREQDRYAVACYIVRVFAIFDLPARVPLEFFNRFQPWGFGEYLLTAPRSNEACYGPYSRFWAALAYLRYSLLASDCHATQASECHATQRYYLPGIFYTRFASGVVDVVDSKLCFQSEGAFLMKACGSHGLRGLNDDFWYFTVDDGKVQAVIVVYNGKSSTWLSKDGQSWSYTEDTAKVLSLSEAITGVICDDLKCEVHRSHRGFAQWNTDDGNFEVPFTHDSLLDRYLHIFDPEGVARWIQVLMDVEYLKQEERERLRSARVATYTKEERAMKTAREGRFWILATDC
jgi:hypothetical protein